MKNLNKVLRKYREEELPVIENAVGCLVIKPSYRKAMKEQIMAAWIKDLEEELDPEVVSIVHNIDGIMLVCENDSEGCYTIENMLKIKNVDYDPYDR